MLSITDSENSFEVSTKQSSMLEIQLNVSQHGKRWSAIGDVLFNYGTKDSREAETLTVSTEQYMYLYMLFTVGQLPLSTVRD